MYGIPTIQCGNHWPNIGRNRLFLRWRQVFGVVSGWHSTDLNILLSSFVGPKSGDMLNFKPLYELVRSLLGPVFVDFKYIKPRAQFELIINLKYYKIYNPWILAIIIHRIYPFHMALNKTPNELQKVNHLLESNIFIGYESKGLPGPGYKKSKWYTKKRFLLINVYFTTQKD